MFNTEISKPNLCDNNDIYILVKGAITIVGVHTIQIGLKNCTSFTECIAKIDGTTKDNAEDLDMVMPKCNLLEYSSNYSDTTDSLWFSSKDEATNFNDDIENSDESESFKYKAKLLRSTVADDYNGILNNATITVSLKYNFCRSLEMPLIN